MYQKTDEQTLWKIYYRDFNKSGEDELILGRGISNNLLAGKKHYFPIVIKLQ